MNIRCCSRNSKPWQVGYETSVTISELYVRLEGYWGRRFPLWVKMPSHNLPEGIFTIKDIISHMHLRNLFQISTRLFLKKRTSKRRRFPSKHSGVDLDNSGILVILQPLFNTKNKEVLRRTTRLLFFHYNLSIWYHKN